jgi:hypothetical protein
MLMGQYLLADLGLSLAKLDHRVFERSRKMVEERGEACFNRAIDDLAAAVRAVHPTPVSLRRLSATFRRSDLFDYLPKPDPSTGLPD